MKNFINIADIDKKDLRQIIDQAKLQKKTRSNHKFVILKNLNTNRQEIGLYLLPLQVDLTVNCVDYTS